MGRVKWMKAFCRLLGFELMPRIRRIGEQRLYLPHSAQRQDYPNLQSVLTKAIDWELISQQYDQMIKYATAAPENPDKY